MSPVENAISTTHSPIGQTVHPLPPARGTQLTALTTLSIVKENSPRTTRYVRRTILCFFGCFGIICGHSQTTQTRYYYAIENLDTATVIRRGVTTSAGIPNNQLILAPTTNYREWLFQADTGLIGFTDFRTPGSGGGFNIPPITLRLPISADSDGDGLTDDAEFVVGSNPNNPYTFLPNILDAEAVRQGLTDARATFTGVQASVDIPGTAVDVSAFSDIVAVANSTGGITVFNVFNRMQPLIIAQVETANALAVSCAGSNLIAVADGSGGLAVVEVTDPPNARLARRINVGGTAQAVATAGGLAFVGAREGMLSVVDMATGLVLQQTNIGPIEDLAIAGDSLYAYANGQLQVLTNALSLPQVAGSVASPGNINAQNGRGRIFAAGGFAYLVHNRGYNIFSVTNPSQPTALTNVATAQFGWKQVVFNGSGAAVAAVGTSQAFDTPQNIYIFSTTNPANFGTFQQEIATPGFARAVSIYNGLAYVADDFRGLQVINYLPLDTAGRPPTITLQGSFNILSPTNGLAEGGQLVRLAASVADDVQVRNVELYLDGAKIATDGNFPFEFHFVTPPRTPNRTSFRLRTRASDTGGNFTFTPEMTVQVLPDIRPPQVTKITPRDSSAVGNISSIAIFFSEPIRTNSLSGYVALVEAGPDSQFGTVDDRAITNFTLLFREDVLGLFINLSTNLAYGSYRLSISTNVTDLNSNALATAISSDFRVVPCLQEIPGLVAWWSGDGDAEDIVGGNSGTLVNRVSYSVGQVGAAFDLTVAPGYVSIPSDPAFDFSETSPMSLELWAYRSSPAGVMHFLGKRSNCGDIQYQMAFDGSGTGFGSYHGSVGISGWQPPLNVWIHYAVTFNGSNFVFYTNGVKAATGNGRLGPAYPDPLEIGNAGTCGQTFGQTFVGLIDEVSFYNRVLSSNEIADIYSVGTVGKCKDIAPRAIHFSPLNSSVVETTRLAAVYFNKSIEPSTLSSNSLFLTEAGLDRVFGTPDDHLISTATLAHSNSLNAAFLLFTNALPNGRYRLTATRAITDLGGKALYAQTDGTFWVLPGGPDGDADNDGLTNTDEALRGTDPFLADTDGDGWTDEVEVSDATNPLDPNSHPRQTFVAAPPIEIVFPGPDETGSPGAGTHVASPPLDVILPGTDETGAPGTGTIVALPPVEIALPGADETGIAGSGTTIGYPPIEVIFPGVDETGSPGAGTTVALPPIEIVLPDVDETGAPSAGTTLALPPVTIQYTTNQSLSTLQKSVPQSNAKKIKSLNSSPERTTRKRADNKFEP